MRLIDADELKGKAIADPDDGEYFVYCQDIDEAPTVDAVPVVRFQEREEAVAQLRKKWQDAEMFICTMCGHFDHSIDGNIVYGNKDCGEIVGYPCCKKFTPRMPLPGTGACGRYSGTSWNRLKNGIRIRENGTTERRGRNENWLAREMAAVRQRRRERQEGAAGDYGDGGLRPSPGQVLRGEI